MRGMMNRINIVLRGLTVFVTAVLSGCGQYSVISTADETKNVPHRCLISIEAQIYPGIHSTYIPPLLTNDVVTLSLDINTAVRAGTAVATDPSGRTYSFSIDIVSVDIDGPNLDVIDIRFNQADGDFAGINRTSQGRGALLLQGPKNSHNLPSLPLDEAIWKKFTYDGQIGMPSNDPANLNEAMAFGATDINSISVTCTRI